MNLSQTRILITGAHGMLATDVVEALGHAGAADVTLTDRDELDILDAEAVAAAVAGTDLIINCAAFTAVDAAEEQEDLALAVNATGPANIARAAATAGARMIHISTDYVFAGDAATPYAEDATMNPASAYGRTKAEGENEVRASGADALILRTAWLYGRGGPCFPKTIAKAGRERGALSVVDDQMGQPTWTRDVAAFMIRLLEANAPAGTYHATSDGQCSWYDFAKEIAASAGLGDIVSPTDSSAYQRPAPRPAWSVLGHDAHEALGIEGIGNWRERWAVAADEVLA
ncbi:dTDP-4-dehydrorhamnose reductase [Demequina sp. TTPB684]|uniref:dTDP-4-dehydrorhamnose reductase n=1 Tax=unclassified Demequina TaxID=2620311 RepID=UPI001CF31F9D|nr:dTDP-4-dehydrorhamnose reductase [Demequina sp. TMPB413]MCB2412732.1 dTDP-4-dehydrorhamnose reductase [Demequina sp. TTPB684]